jgi:hypothetical protein
MRHLVILEESRFPLTLIGTTKNLGEGW